MPGGDKTGPNGIGPMTGRGAGYCAGYSTPGYINPVSGRSGFGVGRGGAPYGGGRGRTFGGGRDYGSRYYADYPAPNYPNVSEKTILENEIKILSEQMKSLEKRLSEIKEEKK